MVPAALTRLGGPVEAVVIGGSAGSLGALEGLLPGLPFQFSPVLVAIHILPTAPSLLSEIFGPKCSMRVGEAEAFEPIEPGSIYFAPADYHLLVESSRRCALSIAPPVNFSRPAIDLLFESAADVYRQGLVGVVLSGASADGARGLRAIHDAGGTALVQDPKTAEAPQMPRAAIEAVPSARVLGLGALLQELIARGTRS